MPSARFLILVTIDRRWKDHLYGMDHLRAAIGSRGYGQKDPKMRYKEEAFKLFVQMQGLVRQDLTKLFFRVQIQIADPAAEAAAMPAPGPQGSLAAGGFKPAPTPECVRCVGTCACTCTGEGFAGCGDGGGC